VIKRHAAPIAISTGEYRIVWLFAIGVGVITGLLLATQSLPVSVVVLAVVALMLLSFITPITALVALLVFAPMRTLIATEASFHLPLDIGQLLFVAFVGVWGIHKIVVEKRLLRFTWSDLYTPLLSYVLILILTVFNAVSIGAWITEWLKWVLLVILVAFVLDLGQRRGWEWIIFGLALAGSANAVVGIYTFFGGSGALHLLVNNRFFRAFGTFGQPNPFGGFMGLLVPLAAMTAYGYLARIWDDRKVNGRISLSLVALLCFYACASLLMVLALFFSWSRGAWLGFGVSMIVVLFALPRRFWQSVLGVLLMMSVLGAAWSTGILPSSIVDRVSSATQELFVLTDVRAVDITPENYAIVERLAHWQAAINMTEQHPWLGVGLGNYEATYNRYRLLNWEESLGHAHNYYLNVLGETGIIGLAAYLAVFVRITWLTWQTRAHPDTLSRCVVVGLLGSWSYLLVHSLTDNLYVNNVFIHLGVMLGILAVLRREVIGQVIVKMKMEQT
jgi:putative inorganic carbon (hco3(-)) transporter